MLFDDIHNNFFTWVLNSLKKGKQIKVATDLESNPTWIPFFSKAIMKSIFLDSSGLFHYGSDKPISRFEFACRIADRFNYNKQLIRILSELLSRFSLQSTERATKGCYEFYKRSFYKK